LFSKKGLTTTVVEQVVNILKITLNPSKDAQMRTRFLLLIPEIFLSSFMLTCFETIINNMIMPNIIWKAGKAANAVRMSAVASLALIMQIDAVKSIQVN
jgi:dynein assembly factor 5